MRIATLVVVALMATVVVASAQTPYFAVYFDQYHGVMSKNCPGPVADVLYVAAVNLNMLIVGAEFKIEYPAALWYVGDVNTPPVTVGQTNTGISMAWALPESGWGILDLCQVGVLWMCSECVPPYVDNQIKVVAHPGTAFLGVTDYPGYSFVPVTGMTSLVCATVPAEETTWGQVKAIYGE
jgi:hypothetical protein